MKLEMITEGLNQLLTENHYSSGTIEFYKKEWRKINDFLKQEYGSTEYNMEKGLKYLEVKYSFIQKYENKVLSQQRVQLLRVVHMLEDYRLHRVLTRRYYASKNPIKLNDSMSDIFSKYSSFLSNTDLSVSTINHYKKTSQVFLDFITQRKVAGIQDITTKTCHDFIKTFAGFQFKTVEQQVCGIRHFLRFLHSSGMIVENFIDKIHVLNISKTANIPSSWDLDDLKKMLSAIDRNNPIGKRDYAMILIACTLGLRVGDIKRLRFNNFNWEEKKLSIIQHKTKKPLSLPIPDYIGWAVIDYIKNARPKAYKSDVVFIKHMPPFDPFSDDSHLQNIVTKYMRKAKIDSRSKKRSGFHSLRHSVGSLLLEIETPLPVITQILGHTDPDVTAIYLKTDIKKLAECTLEPEDFRNE